VYTKIESLQPVADPEVWNRRRKGRGGIWGGSI